MNIDLSRMNPKQRLFMLARTRYVGYGGARGGGKSWAVRAKALLLCMNYPGICQLIVRRTIDELRKNLMNPIRDIVGKEARWKEDEKTLYFPNGSQLTFGYCDAERDVLRYQGQQYDCIYLDEATQLTEYQFQTFKGCLRGVNDFPKRMYVTCNPGGVGHAWVKRLFIDRDYRQGEREEDYSFIQALVTDNTVLLEKDPEYINNLDSLPYELREAWRYGKWDVFAGQFFTEWNRAVHVVAPHPIPAHWRRYVTLDYGMDMLAAYLIAVDEHGNATVLREVYEGRDLGEGHNGMIISEAAEAIKEMVGEDPVYEYLAPPDLWGSRQESGRSVADIFAERGIYLSKTSHEHMAGWAAMREMLKVRPDETGTESARLRIFGTCVNLIRTLPLLTYDNKRPGDCAGEPHELTHASDAIRGFCVYWLQNAEEPAPEKKADPIREAMRRKKRRK